MESLYVKKENSTKRVVFLGLFMGLNMMATFINVPIGPSMMHLGTTMLFITALILKPKDAALASGGGMFLFDVVGGYMSYAPFTLVIKGLMAFVVAIIAQRQDSQGKNIKLNAMAYIAGGIISLVGYYFTNAYFAGDFMTPLAKIPGSLLTTSAGIVIALPIGIQVRRVIEKI